MRGGEIGPHRDRLAGEGLRQPRVAELQRQLAERHPALGVIVLRRMHAFEHADRFLLLARGAERAHEIVADHIRTVAGLERPTQMRDRVLRTRGLGSVAPSAIRNDRLVRIERQRFLEMRDRRVVTIARGRCRDAKCTMPG